MKTYEYDDWDIVDDETQERTYIDNDGNKITGILKDFFYYKENDDRNDQYVENGKY